MKNTIVWVVSLNPTADCYCNELKVDRVVLYLDCHTFYGNCSKMKMEMTNI